MSQKRSECASFDLRPKSPKTKALWFTIRYVFVGLAIIGGFIGVIGKSLAENASEEGDEDEDE